MPPFLQNIVNKITEIFGKLDKTKRIILAGAAVFLLIVTAVLVNVSSTEPNVLLFEDMESAEYSKVTQKLDEMNLPYSTSGGKNIFVAPEHKNQIVHSLAQDNLLPTGVEGWRLFDIKSWDETQFDKKIKLQRALKGALERSIQSLRKVKKAIVNLAVPESEYFQNNVSPVKAAVIVHLIPGVQELNKKEVKGITRIVQRAVPKLREENISVADSNGNIISSQMDDIESEKLLEVKLVKLKLAIQEEERVKKLVDIKKTLEKQYPNRIEIARLDLELNWDEQNYKEKTYFPVVMKKDDPKTPYNEEEVKDSLTLSEQKTTEKFIGKGMTPDGPAGAEPNIPPGYKDTDYQKALYEKIINTRNNLVNERNTSMNKQPWSIASINMAVIVDGKWQKVGVKEDGSGYLREYTPVSDEEIQTVKKLLESAVGLNRPRGDKLEVAHLQRDRSAEFEEEDAKLRAERMRRNILLATLITFVSLFAMFLIYRAIRKEIERRRRQREEELARQQQLMREAALRVAEDEGAEYELSADEKARREMLENAINLAREKPEEVALLLRTWLAEE